MRILHRIIVHCHLLVVIRILSCFSDKKGKELVLVVIRILSCFSDKKGKELVLWVEPERYFLQTVKAHSQAEVGWGGNLFWDSEYLKGEWGGRKEGMEGYAGKEGKRGICREGGEERDMQGRRWGGEGEGEWGGGRKERRGRERYAGREGGRCNKFSGCVL